MIPHVYVIDSALCHSVGSLIPELDMKARSQQRMDRRGKQGRCLTLSLIFMIDSRSSPCACVKTNTVVVCVADAKKREDEYSASYRLAFHRATLVSASPFYVNNT